MRAKLDNINLSAKSPKQLRDFYVSVIGLQELEYISQPPELYMIDCKGCTLSIRDSANQQHNPGVEGVELGFEVDDIDALYNKIKHSTGHIVSEEIQTQWGLAFTAADPEGHRLNIYRFSNVNNG